MSHNGCAGPRGGSDYETVSVNRTKTLSGEDLDEKIESLLNPDESVLMPASSLEEERRGRGRPPTLDPSQKRDEALRCGVTKDELKACLVASAEAGFKKPQDWMRHVLLTAAGVK